MSSETRHGPLSHLQLIPADSITALYDNDNQTLLLKANGERVDITRDIRFHQLPFVGGLLFELQGWVGPVVQGDSHYSITDKFPIQLPSRVFPSNTVVVNTENKKGWVIPIKPLLKDGPQETQTAPQGEAPANLPEVKVIPGNQDIDTGLGLKFKIRQSDKFKGEGGTVNIVFDPAFLYLIDASIIDDGIEWTFESHQTGATEIAVYVGQAKPPFVYRVVHGVSIAPPNSEAKTKPIATFSVSPANGSSNGNGIKAASKDHPGVLKWDGVINAGYNVIKKQFPDAHLYVVEARPATTKPVETEWGLVRNTIIARIDNNRHAIIKSTGWGDFGPVKVINEPILGGDNIRWPVPLDIHDAFGILRKGGYKEPVDEVTLRKPLYPGIDQAFYFFQVGGQSIPIGVDDRKIHPSGLTEQKA
ncbi:hypothetical protein FALBO_1472 [Fusarium albosuccineum]|uniref:Uncharacterized protein n=1 Tax=Fusarium albosuccineum TaxID=1237068 RepID=A0A8H4LNU3_9HYPO|nr:hypothetical protein FALBO_1472 [Fusarium albosuccineum]